MNPYIQNQQFNFNSKTTEQPQQQYQEIQQELHEVEIKYTGESRPISINEAHNLYAQLPVEKQNQCLSSKMAHLYSQSKQQSNPACHCCHCHYPTTTHYQNPQLISPTITDLNSLYVQHQQPSYDKKYNSTNDCYLIDNSTKSQHYSFTQSDKVGASHEISRNQPTHQQFLMPRPYPVERVSTLCVLPRKASVALSQLSMTSSALAAVEERRSLLEGSVEFTI